MHQQPEERFTYLFNRYYNRTASPSEMDEFLALVEQSDDQLLETNLSKAWLNLSSEDQVIDGKKSESIRQQILHSESAGPIVRNIRDKKIFYLKWMAGISAALAVTLSCWFYLQHSKPISQKTIFAQSKIKHDISPGGNKAYLTLADGSRVTLDTLKPGTVARQGNMQINKDASGSLTYVAIPQKNTLANPNEINTLTTPNGGQYMLVLADGTKVWLNAASSLQFPIAFNGHTRSVTLKGEAYFEVSKNLEKPFIVRSDNTYIKVLGTHFNVMSYQNEAVKKTTLLEGAIEISNGSSHFLVKPSEQVHIINNILTSPKKVDAEAVVAWKNGFFDFQKADIDYILRQVSRWYGVEIKYQGAIPKGLYTGRISKEVKISKLLDMLQYTGLKYNLVNNTVVVSE